CGARIAIHAGCSGAFARGMLDGELVAHDEPCLHDGKERQRDQRRDQGQLDGGLATLTSRHRRSAGAPHLAEDLADDGVEELADGMALRRPGQEQRGHGRGAEDDQRVLGGRLPELAPAGASTPRRGADDVHETLQHLASWRFDVWPRYVWWSEASSAG